MAITKEVIKTYALENALKYGGTANEKAVLASLFSEGLDKSKIKEIMPLIIETVRDVNRLTLEDQEKKLKKSTHETHKREVRIGLPPLPNAEDGKVVMRFAPYPSGPLHIGNSRTLILNDEYAKMYNGKLILVIDDTIGSVEKPIEPTAYKLIEESIHWLNCKIEKKVIHKSDRIEKYYEYAKELIQKGYMYVCDCEAEKRRELKLKGIDCSCRHLGPDKQLERWEEMFTSPQGSMCVRLKTSMQDPDPAFRDRIMFRISDRPHPRTGTKYRIYPLLDFSWAIDDHFLGITHILRGMELAIETRTQKFIWDIFDWKHPEIIYNGHFGLTGVKISKSKGAKEVKSGTYRDWDDPRTWSLQSLQKRGILPESIREFIVSMGLRKTNITIPLDVLYSINKKNLENSPRYFFVENPTKIRIAGCPELTAKIPLHPNGKLGFKEYKTGQEFYITNQDFELMENRNYRLMHLINFKSDNILKIKPRTFSYISNELNQNLNVKFIHWLPDTKENINTEIIMPDGKIVKGLSEPQAKNIRVGDIVQLERFGFVRLNKKEDDKLEFWFAHI